MNKILVFIPTYNELDNVVPICEQILALPLALDLHFMDDASPDGTGEILDRLTALHPQVTVSHRRGKLGIGTAHLEGIAYAYRNNYELLITMDCDFTHNPLNISDLLSHLPGHQVVLGSRFLKKKSLPGWSLYRQFMTNFGHYLTRKLLHLRYDATGAFRLYDLRALPSVLFKLVRSKSYPFFYESLFIISNNGFRIREIPVILPSRTYGHSKLSTKEALRSLTFLFRLSLEHLANPGRFRLGREPDRLREDLHDPQDWAPYWKQKKEASGFLYETVAALYRNLILRPILKNTLYKAFTPGTSLLHAGCGSGQVDIDIQSHFKLTAVDISKDALTLYSRYNPDAFRIEQASILDLPFENEQFDGVYNLGVVEHFPEEDIIKILTEFHRVLKPGGKVVIFWPHRYATSVIFLKSVRWLARKLWKKEIQLHPAEISLLASKAKAKSLFAAAQLDLLSCRMSLWDGFVQAILIAENPRG